MHCSNILCGDSCCCPCDNCAAIRATCCPTCNKPYQEIAPITNPYWNGWWCGLCNGMHAWGYQCLRTLGPIYTYTYPYTYIDPANINIGGGSYTIS